MPSKPLCAFCSRILGTLVLDVTKHPQLQSWGASWVQQNKPFLFKINISSSLMWVCWQSFNPGPIKEQPLRQEPCVCELLNMTEAMIRSACVWVKHTLQTDAPVTAVSPRWDLVRSVDAAAKMTRFRDHLLITQNSWKRTESSLLHSDPPTFCCWCTFTLLISREGRGYHQIPGTRDQGPGTRDFFSVETHKDASRVELIVSVEKWHNSTLTLATAVLCCCISLLAMFCVQNLLLLSILSPEA